MFTIHGAKGPAAYHVECQSTTDGRMGFRIWEHDTPAASAGANMDKDGVVTILYPKAGILYLRPPASLKGDIVLNVVLSEGSARHRIRVLRPDDYSWQEMLRPDHLLMLPFYLFRHESRFGKMTGEEKAGVVEEMTRIRDGLSALVNDGTIASYEEDTIREMWERVSSELSRDTEIEEGVRRVMEGVINFRGKMIHDEAMKEGERIRERMGEKRGRKEGAF